MKRTYKIFDIVNPIKFRKFLDEEGYMIIDVQVKPCIEIIVNQMDEKDMSSDIYNLLKQYKKESSDGEK